jgi:uncharacterized protein YjbI with pentapeptide repeats
VPRSVEGAKFSVSNLEGASFLLAQLQGSELFEANLKGANLHRTNLTGANLENADLTGADLRFSRFDRETNLTGARLAGVSLDQIVLDNTNLTAISWEGVAPLGDDKLANGIIEDYSDPRLTGRKDPRRNTRCTSEGAC